MSTVLEQAQAELAAAQKKVAALSLVPEEDNYPVRTVLRWHLGGNNLPRVAVKVGPHVWIVTSYAAQITWPALVAQFLTYPLAYFEVAPEDWGDARLAPPPPLATDGLTLTDSAGHTWHRVGNEWVLDTQDGGL